MACKFNQHTGLCMKCGKPHDASGDAYNEQDNCEHKWGHDGTCNKCGAPAPVGEGIQGFERVSRAAAKAQGTRKGTGQAGREASPQRRPAKSKAAK